MNLRIVKNFAFALALLTGFAGFPGLSSLSAALAQRQQPYQEPYQERERDRMGERRMVVDEEGFLQGYRHGRRDALRGARFYPWNYSDYQMGDNFFRKSFLRGYQRGYQYTSDRY